MINSGITLCKKIDKWDFVSEAALENFFWANLEQLLDLIPLKRQYICRGEICDIIAVDDQKGLAILELKNVEDRYLIPQLTRYYANLIEEKPFAQEINYSRPVRLIGVTPAYHRHNLIDAEYSRLDFELLQFLIVEDSENFYFKLQDREQKYIARSCQISYQPIKQFQVKEDIPEPPDQLIQWLGGCTKEEQEGFLKIRSKILSCSPRMKEMVEKRVIQYGSGKTRLCAEICFQTRMQKPILFLWLPTPSSYRLTRPKKFMIGRLRIWTNGQTISHVGHVPERFGKMKTKAEWEQVPLEKRRYLKDNLSSRSHFPCEVEGYLECRNSSEMPDFWEALSDLAIKKWLEKQ